MSFSRNELKTHCLKAQCGFDSR